MPFEAPVPPQKTPDKKPKWDVEEARRVFGGNLKTALGMYNEQQSVLREDAEATENFANVMRTAREQRINFGDTVEVELRDGTRVRGVVRIIFDEIEGIKKKEGSIAAYSEPLRLEDEEEDKMHKPLFRDIKSINKVEKPASE